MGICVTQFDPKSVERCLVCSPGALPTIFGISHYSLNFTSPLPHPFLIAGLFKVTKVRYHKLSCLTGSKLHGTMQLLAYCGTVFTYSNNWS